MLRGSGMLTDVGEQRGNWQQIRKMTWIAAEGVVGRCAVAAALGKLLVGTGDRYLERETPTVTVCDID